MNQGSPTPRVVFFGTSDFALPSLQILFDAKYTIVSVVTAPDQPRDRKRTITPSPVKGLALQLGLTVHTPGKLDDTFLKTFKELRADVCIIVAYGKIIRENYLSVPRFGFINIHPSLLPHYRGPSPIQTAILNGERETGITLQRIDAQVDHGPILAQTKYEIPRNQYYPEVAQTLSQRGADLLVNTLPRYLNGELQLEEQDHGRATFSHMLSRKDGEIDWSRSAEEILNQIRALSHEPGTWTTWQGETLRIMRAEVSNQHSPDTSPGRVIQLENGVAVQTGTGLLAVTIVQREGGKRMNIQQFVQGKKDFIGSILG